METPASEAYIDGNYQNARTKGYRFFNISPRKLKDDSILQHAM